MTSVEVAEVRSRRMPWDEDAARFLADRIGDARIVLIGEASHGTHEFYLERARITRSLVEDKGFVAVAAEADWPDAYKLGCFARGAGEDDLTRVLSVFDRFPRWMWANEVVARFASWLRDHNTQASAGCGFYGLDLYSLRRSMDSVLTYLQETDPTAATRARDRYDCFDRFGDDPADYAYAAFGTETCEEAVVEQLVEMRRTLEDTHEGDAAMEDASFFVRQNALVVKNAEEYYRSMFRGGAYTWNLRDTHMFETLRSLDEHLTARTNTPAKIVVWAHNSHLGDARATSMSRRGELNLGQLVREHYGAEATNVGFTTFEGTVRAADDWGGRDRVKEVRPALEGSYESHLHDVGGDFLLSFPDPDLTRALGGPRLERAIGVIYRPQTERASHYFEAVLPEQFDWLIHLDRTTALRSWDADGRERSDLDELPETYPSGV